MSVADQVRLGAAIDAFVATPLRGDGDEQAALDATSVLMGATAALRSTSDHDDDADRTLARLTALAELVCVRSATVPSALAAGYCAFCATLAPAWASLAVAVRFASDSCHI